MKICFILLAVAALLGCNSYQPQRFSDGSLHGNGHPVPNVKTEMPAEWSLVPAEQAVAMDISHAQIVGELSPDDRKDILLQVGRIKGAEPLVSEIIVLGDKSYAAAAKVEVSGKFVAYVIQLQNGEWVVSRVFFIYV